RNALAAGRPVPGAFLDHAGCTLDGATSSIRTCRASRKPRTLGSSRDRSRYRGDERATAQEGDFRGYGRHGVIEQPPDARIPVITFRANATPRIAIRDPGG